MTLVIRKPLGDTRAAAAAVRSALPLAAVIGLLTGGILAALASGGVLRRMRRLRDDARALHDEGLEHPIAMDDVGDEVGEVARALEDMRRRLLREEADRQEFLSVASHELRPRWPRCRAASSSSPRTSATGPRPAAAPTARCGRRIGS